MSRYCCDMDYYYNLYDNPYSYSYSPNLYAPITYDIYWGHHGHHGHHGHYW